MYHDLEIKSGIGLRKFRDDLNLPLLWERVWRAKWLAKGPGLWFLYLLKILSFTSIASGSLSNVVCGAADLDEYSCAVCW